MGLTQLRLREVPSKTLVDPPCGATIEEQLPNAKLTPQEPNHPRTSLLGLPAELKKQIYDNIFHIPTESSRACEVIDLRSRSVGCRCGAGLSVASKELYQDTRSLFYNSASFVFRAPMACKSFVEAIGHHCLEVGSLELSYQNDIYESSLLQSIFDPLKTSTKLFHLYLRIEARAKEPIRDYPMYMHQQTTYSDGDFWDVEFRPISHPLANLKALRKLTIVGHPGTGEMEEVLYRASKNVERFASSQGQRPYSVGVWARGLVPTYSIEALPDEYFE